MEKLLMNYQNEIKKIWLLVESSSLVMRMGTKLENKGYRVKQVLSEGGPVKVILEKIESFNPEVVLLQAEHPGIDTFELGRQLKTSHRLKPVPLIIFGKENHPQNAVKAYRAGAEYYVALPGENYLCLLNLVEKLAGRSQDSTG